jgi:DNA modification methylase
MKFIILFLRWLLVGDAYSELDKIDTVDYIVTSPPYHNILKTSPKVLDTTMANYTG